MASQKGKEAAKNRPQTFKEGNKGRPPGTSKRLPIPIIRSTPPEKIQEVWDNIVEWAQKGDRAMAKFVCEMALPNQKKTMCPALWDHSLTTLDDVLDYLNHLESLFLEGTISFEDIIMMMEFLEKKAKIGEIQDIKKQVEDIKLILEDR